MKTAHLILIASMAFVSILVAKPIEISQVLIFDDEGEDSTFQELPHLGLDQKLFCLWDGDDLQAFFIPTLEKHEGDIDSFLKVTKRAMVREGGKNVKIEKAGNIKTEQGAVILKCIATFKTGGQKHKSLFYIIPFGGIYQTISVTLVDPNDFDEISVRADRLIKTSTIKS